VRLQTGRTHQIRVHLQDAGHPIVGDPVYGQDWQRGFTGASGRWADELARQAGRLFLHAARLTFRHPLTEERLAFSSPLPEVLASAVAWARDSMAK
jgi:23S rRNA pseudouridine1911/1915/1917 synthase